ncbi:MAG: hypothetical protein QXU75_03445 [Candidatus Methanomethylicaceae archaeon]
MNPLRRIGENPYVGRLLVLLVGPGRLPRDGGGRTPARPGSATKRGLIPHMRIGRVVLYPVKELKRWLEKNVQEREKQPH